MINQRINRKSKKPIQKKMKKILAFVLFSVMTVTGFGQSKNYWSSGGEMIFSLADINDNGSNEVQY